MPVTPVKAPPGTGGTTPPVVADAVRNRPQVLGTPPDVGEAKALVVTVAMGDGLGVGKQLQDL